MKDYIIYILTDGGKFFVGKVKLEQAKRELNQHRSGKYKDTKEWIESNKDNINILWLQEFKGTRKEAFGKEIEWTRYFLDKGWKHSKADSTVVAYANKLTEELDLSEPEKVLDVEIQKGFKELVDSQVKKYNTKSIGVFMKEDEHSEIKRLAKDNNLSMSQYLKQCGLEGKIEVHDYSNLLDLTKKLSSLDQSLKHLVYNDYPNKELVRSEIKDLTKSQDELVLEVRKMLRRIKRRK